MAPSRSSLWLFCLAFAPLVALADTAAGPADTTTAARTTHSASPLVINPQQPPTLDAASCDTNYKTKSTVCKSVTLSQGSTKVRADQAQFICMNCQDSVWKLQGNVRIDAQPRGDLRSDQATVEVRGNRIVRATVVGTPAEFEQQRADNLGMEKGHADQIVYDVGEGTVLLTHDAWISDGHDEMSAPSISYSIREQKVLASSAGATQGVHITITPQSLPKQGSPPPSKGPAGPPPSKGTAGPPQSEGTAGPPQSEGTAGPPRNSGSPPPAPAHSSGTEGTKSPGAILDGGQRRPRSGEAQDGPSTAAPQPQGRS